MNEFLLRIWGKIKDFWAGLPNTGRILWAVIPSVVFIGLIVLAVALARPQYVPLFTNLNEEDAGEIVGALQEKGIPYELSGGGKNILVPSKDVYDTRLELATEGMPKGTGVGYEIFDKTNLGVTDFTQRVNYVRALEGELNRTIINLDNVIEARVHLVIPKKELYEERQKEPTASVLLKLNARQTLDYHQVKAVINLVSSSVEGLKPINVTIVNTKGEILSDAVRDELLESGKSHSYSKKLKLTQQQINIQKELERDIQTKVETMLGKVLGNRRATVRVIAELNFDQVEKKDEVYEPIVGGKGVLRSSKKGAESYTGAGVYPGGVPGTDSNIPGYKSVVSGNSQYTKTESTENYEITKREQHIVEQVGAVKRMSVAVIVDNLQPQQVQSVKNAVVAAAGLNLARGDQVAVENMSFDRSAEKAEQYEGKIADREKYMTTLLSLGIIIGILLFALIFLRSTLKPRAIREKLRKQIEMAAKEVKEEEEVEVPLEAVPSAAELAEAQKRAEMKKQITKIARENPKVIVQLIKRWLTEEKR